ncbi:MAG: amidohydrolase [Bacteroidia bacterium]|nr:amidohydrolase [Bacteroidia bacterium]
MRLSLSLIVFSLSACIPKTPADFALINGNIYTVNPSQPHAEAVAVKDGRIIAVGTNEEIEVFIEEKTEVLDLAGKTVVPGLIESHAHIMGVGENKRYLNLLAVGSYDELVEKVAEAVAKAKPGEWILGRGWHQSKWIPQPEMITGYQTHEKLSAVSPDNPVFLSHASGHAAFANAKAMEIAGITPSMTFGEEGEIIQYPDGRPTGIFTESAAGLIGRFVPQDTPETLRLDLQAAIDECLANGLTSFQDAGSGPAAIDTYEAFVKEGKMAIRLWTMLDGSDEKLLQTWYAKGPHTESEFLTVRAIKLYADGALGSRGAWLLEEYTDRPGHRGNPIMPMDYVQTVSRDALKHGFQVCVHAIGDRANREVLDRFEAAFAESPEIKDPRFRIEHAQHLHPEDIPRFSKLGVIASMQAIHMSSDRPWAIDRLGQKRIDEGAYVWRKLIDSGAKVINGTDAPVEPLSPIACFYASVSRKTLAGEPSGGYEPSQKMTRAEALRSYTLDAAYGAFQEKEKGSIEVGKLGDFTVLSQDIMVVEEEKILSTVIEYTLVGGVVRYKKP